MAPNPYPFHPVLLVDDEIDILESYRMSLRMNRINNLVLCEDSRQVESLLEKQTFSLVVLDLSMPHVPGMTILEMLQQRFPDTPVIIVTGVNDVSTAVECMKKGALDFLLKPVEENKLIAAIHTAHELSELRRENEALRTQMLRAGLSRPEAFSPIITINPAMKAIFSYIEAIAPSTRPVLVTGESGTGKELIARAIHESSGRKGTFVAVNVGGLDDTVFSDTLFGHRKGAFTGADSDRAGLIEKAAGGTLFLDEIGTLQTPSQVKLLRLLQEKQYYPLGADTHRTSNAAIIAATNENLARRTREGSFRTDLYYRLKTHRLHIPPLRERIEDIPCLVEHFAAEAARSMGRDVPEIPDEVFGILGGYTFPGNVRELQAMMHDIVARSIAPSLEPKLFTECISSEIDATVEAAPSCSPAHSAIYYTGPFPTLERVKEFLFEKAMKLSGGNQSVAARMLGISQSSLSRWESSTKQHT